MTDSYRLLVKNKSGRDDMMCVFTELPAANGLMEHLQKIAWLVEPSGSGDVLEFRWSIDWGVFMKRCGYLGHSGVAVQAINCQPASVKDGSHFSLEVENDRFIQLVQKENLSRNAIHIEVNSRVPTGVQIGITMNGKPCMSVDPAMPNFTYTFTNSNPTFYLAFGDYEAGSSVDIVTHNEPFLLEFECSGGGNNKLYVELNSQNKFVVVDGSQQDW